MKNVKINCGYNNINQFPCFKHEYLFASKQIDMFKLEYMRDDLQLFVNSPYILNYLNILILNGELDFDSLSIEFVNEDGTTQDLKVLNERLINTNLHSDTINWIYNTYSNFKQETMEQIREYRYCLNAIARMQAFYEIDCWLYRTEGSHNEEGTTYLIYSFKDKEEGLILEKNNDWLEMVNNIWKEYGKAYDSSLAIFNKDNPLYQRMGILQKMRILQSLEDNQDNFEYFPFIKQ